MTDLRKAAKMALEALEDSMYPQKKQFDAIIDLRQALAQPNITGNSATRSVDSAESFCKQELHNLMSVAGRMALELECLLLDTKDLSVVSKWWDTGMESLQAYRDYIWSITHGKEEIIALAQPEQDHLSDAMSVLADVNADLIAVAKLAQPWDTSDMAYRPNGLSVEQEPVAYMTYKGYLYHASDPKVLEHSNPTPLYTAPPSKPWVSLSDEDIKEGAKYSWVDYQAFQSVAWWADEKLKDKNT